MFFDSGTAVKDDDRRGVVVGSKRRRDTYTYTYTYTYMCTFMYPCAHIHTHTRTHTLPHTHLKKLPVAINTAPNGIARYTHAMARLTACNSDIASVMDESQGSNASRNTSAVFLRPEN